MHRASFCQIIFFKPNQDPHWVVPVGGTLRLLKAESFHSLGVGEVDGKFPWFLEIEVEKNVTVAVVVFTRFFFVAFGRDILTNKPCL